MSSAVARKILFLFLLIIGIEFFVYSYDPVLRGDEITYCYVLDWEHNGFGYGYGIGSNFQQIESFGDVISSQIDHFNHWGGRNLVHGVEQFFSGVSTPTVFDVVNTIVLLFTITLMVYVAVGRQKMQVLSPWLIAVVGMLYLLPWSLYILSSINLSCNYLWPMFGLLLVYAMWRYVSTHDKKNNIFVYFGLGIVSFIAGWSHEAYCLALSGSFFFYYIFHVKQLRGSQAWIVIGYWLGTLMMISAPGNFLRFGGHGESRGLTYWIMEFLFALPRLKCVYLFLISLLYFRIKRKCDYKNFVRDYRILIVAWILGFLFICLVHTVSQSFTGIEMLSILLIICLFKPLFSGKKNRLVAIIMAIVCIHIGFISVYEFRQNRSEQEAIERYASSPDGVSVNYTKKCTNPLISPWLRHPLDNFRRYPLIEKRYARNQNTLILVTPEDEAIMKSPETFMVEENRFGDGPFYAIEGCSKVWGLPDSSLLQQDYVWCFDKPKWNEELSIVDRINSIIDPDAVAKSMPTERPEIINTRYGEFLIIDIPTHRRIIGISVKE